MVLPIGISDKDAQQIKAQLKKSPFNSEKMLDSKVKVVRVLSVRWNAPCLYN